MRSADATTLLRLPLLAIVIYAILVRAGAVAVLLALALLFASDAADGYMGTDHRHTLSDFVHYLLEEAHLARKRERRRPTPPGYAAYLDIAVDRVVEYGLWLAFTALYLLPWYVIVIVFIRNTIADALVVGKKKNFGNMKSGFGRIASSHISRGAYAILKAVNFGYLALVAVAAWPIGIGYVLTIGVVAFSLLRGAAEISEALR
ncbi:MAG: hypothetical protein M1286_04390 [Candidatus Marsarchaeota archaeon]|nr:hypothetical protein [Candidatus Marsarchaeota archaeon]